MKMEPYGDYLLLKEREKAEKTQSGIIMLEGLTGDYIYADVIKAGPGLYTHSGVKIPMTVKKGNTVLLHKSNAGDQKRVKIDNEEYLIVRESEIVMMSTTKQK